MNGDIARTVQWMSALDPRFAAELRGADQDRIEQLEEAQGHSCPEVFREYLQVMGEHPSWFFVNDIDFRLSALLRWHQRRGSSPSGQYTLIGVDRSDSQKDFFLEETEAAAPLVVAFPWYKGTDLWSTLRHYRSLQAGSLPELICGVGFDVYRLEPQPVKERWQSPRGSIDMERLDQSLLGLGIRRLWFSTVWEQYYEHAEAAVRVSGGPDREPVIIAGASAPMMLSIRQSVDRARVTVIPNPGT